MKRVDDVDGPPRTATAEAAPAGVIRPHTGMRRRRALTPSILVMTNSTGSGRARLLVVLAVVGLSLNLRPVVNAVGALLPEIREALDLSATVGGALTSVPPLSFAILGLVAPGLAGRFGTERVVAVSLAAMTAGQFVRVLTPSVPLLFAGSILAVAGLAMCNVLLPSLIRRFFPDRIPVMTAVYTTGLAVGATASSALSVPIERALDANWQLGLGGWGVTAAIALIPWLMLLVEKPTTTPGVRQSLPLRSLLRSPVAWGLGLYFGLQSSQAYIVTAWLSQIAVDAGLDLKQGGYAVAVFASLGIPLSAAIPALLVRQARLPGIIVALGTCYVAGYLGLLLAPAGGIWLWSVLTGIGSGAFPLALTLIALRARTSEGVASLSAFTQGVGYLLATVGPITIGGLRDLTGGWSVPLFVLIGAASTMIIVGLRVARPRMLEDDLPRAPGPA